LGRYKPRRRRDSVGELKRYVGSAEWKSFKLKALAEITDAIEDPEAKRRVEIHFIRLWKIGSNKPKKSPKKSPLDTF